jgi:hypothetical protein
MESTVQNTYVLLLNAQGKEIHFYNRGFSVNALNTLMKKLRDESFTRK